MTHATTPPAPTRLTARSPEDLIAAAAVVLGFWPQDSVVMLTFDARHPFHARVDLPDPDASEPADLAELAATLVAPAVHHRVGRVALLVCTPHVQHAEAAWRALRSALDTHGVTVVEALGVGPDHWWSLRDDPSPGRRVRLDAERLACHPFLAQAVVDGRVLHGSRADLAASLRPDLAAVDRVRALVEALPTRAPDALASAAAQLAEGTWVHRRVTDHLRGRGERLDDAETARMLCALQCLRVRDAAWSAIGRADARAGVGLMADLLRRAPAELVPAAAALLAWSAWQAGDGALAWCALDRCEEVDPAYGLAGLIAEALERAVPPTVMPAGFDWTEGLVDRAGD